MHGERLFLCQSIRRAGQIIGFCPAIIICAYKSAQGIKHQIISKDIAFMTSERFCLFLMLLLIRWRKVNPQRYPGHIKGKMSGPVRILHIFTVIRYIHNHRCVKSFPRFFCHFLQECSPYRRWRYHTRKSFYYSPEFPGSPLDICLRTGDGFP